MSKWSSAFWADYAERVGSALIYAAMTFALAIQTSIDFGQLWPVVGLPVFLSACKGLLANLKNPESGASLLPAPPGPVIDDGPAE